ncbi:MAG: beta-lactamase family protein [Asgard group archaeon]|nr:beta-lactamase family protein [Asgard group archaeon]
MKIEEITPSSFNKLTQYFQNFIEIEETGSILFAAYHKGKLAYCNKFGLRDREEKIPIEFDDIFRFYSMTKPIVCLAALTLYEDGKFNLDDPIENFLPEFKNMKVLKSYDQKTDGFELIDTKNRITIKHLFTHTSGLSYGFYPGVPIDKLYGKEFGYVEDNRAKEVIEAIPKMEILEKFSRRLSTLPLFFEPGTRWWYGYNHEILGLLIEKLSGKKLDVFLREQIFDKLGMNDTDFYVPEEKRKRLAKPYMKKLDEVLIEVKGPISEGFNSKPKFLSGGGGLLSTLEDYLKFCIMMMNGGEWNGIRIVSSKTIEMMTSNQFSDRKTTLDMQYYEIEDPEIRKHNEGYGFGLGVIVKIADNMTRGGIGEYGWGGAADTVFKIDPSKQTITIMLSQHIPPDNNWIHPIPQDNIKISKLVYDALGI